MRNDRARAVCGLVLECAKNLRASKIRLNDARCAQPLYLALFVFVVTSTAEDWPRFLGPRADGTSSETGLIDSWGEKGPPLLWELNIGTGYCAPAVRSNTLVLFHRQKNFELVEGRDPMTGKFIWRHNYPSAFIDPYGYNNGPRASPLLTEDKCYAFGAEGKLSCVELRTGKLVWERNTAKDWTIPEAFFGVGSSPIIEGNALIVMVGGQPNSGVVAFDPQTGKTLWQSVGEKNWQGIPMTGWRGERTVEWNPLEKQASYSTPVAATVNGQRQVFCLMRQGLVSLNPTNGAVNFSFWFRSTANDSVNAMNPVVVDNMVLISGAYYHVGAVLLQVQPGNKEVKELWRSTALEVHWDTPIYKDGFVYAFSGRNEPDAYFRCVEYKTGRVMWDRDERWRGHEAHSPTFGRGSAILADGKLFCLGEAGLLGIVKPTPEKAEEVCRAQIPQLHYPCWAGPILSNKRLYVRSEDKLLCFDLAKK
jgi:outer membrane protein assembly factor BamB